MKNKTIKQIDKLKAFKEQIKNAKRTIKGCDKYIKMGEKLKIKVATIKEKATMITEKDHQ